MEPLALLIVAIILVGTLVLSRLIALLVGTVENWEKNAWVYNWPRCPYCDHPVDERRKHIWPAAIYPGGAGDEGRYHPACYFTMTTAEQRMGRPGPRRKEIR